LTVAAPDDAGAPPPTAGRDDDPVVAEFTMASGRIAIVRGGEAREANPGDRLSCGDVIDTGAAGSAGIRLQDGTLFVVSGGRLALSGRSRAADEAAGSTVLAVRHGTFAYLRDQTARADDLRIATRFGTVRAKPSGTGIGLVTLAALILYGLRDAYALTGVDAILDDDVIAPPDRPHGVYDLHLPDGRVVVIDNPDDDIIVKIGSSGRLDVESVPVTAAELVQRAQEVLQVHAIQTNANDLSPKDMNGGPGSSVNPLSNGGPPPSSAPPSQSAPGTHASAGPAATGGEGVPSSSTASNFDLITTPLTVATAVPPSDVVHWVSSTGGIWSGPVNWSTGTIPASGVNAVLDAPGSYTVTSPGTVAVSGLTIRPGITLDITGTFQLTTAVNGGAIDVGPGGLLELGVAGGTAGITGGTIGIAGTLIASGTPLFCLGADGQIRARPDSNACICSGGTRRWTPAWSIENNGTN
jgi:hypothetical protein